MSTPETAAQTERAHPLPYPTQLADARRNPQGPATYIEPPTPTAPMAPEAEEPRKTTTIQRVGWAIAALSVGVGIYMFFIA